MSGSLEKNNIEIYYEPHTLLVTLDSISDHESNGRRQSVKEDSIIKDTVEIEESLPSPVYNYKDDSDSPLVSYILCSQYLVHNSTKIELA